MEIKTIDDLIDFMRKVIDWNKEIIATRTHKKSYPDMLAYQNCIIQSCISWTKELKVNMEAKQSKDRELLESLTLPHLTEEELIMASTHSLFHGSFELALQVRRHLEENP